MSAALFRLDHGSYEYGPERPALRDVTFEIMPRERLAILGANGSGKSTLLKVLDGLVWLASGSLWFEGEPLTEEKLDRPSFRGPFRRRVGFVFQNPDLQLFSSSVWEEIAFGPLQLGWDRTEIRPRIKAVMDQLRITHLAGRAPYELSGGEKKRVAIAAVLATDPEIILLDEPTLALDPRSRWELVDLLQDLAHGGKTLVTATNDMEIVDAIADRLVVLSEERTVLREGPAAQLLADSGLLERANLIHVHTHRHAGAEHRHAHTHPAHGAEHHRE
jgi:cobalt/nickel transport system ATP-binding protein